MEQPVDKRGRQVIFEPIAERMICKGYEEGEDVQEMADAFGVSYNTILDTVKRHPEISIRPVGPEGHLDSTYKDKSHQPTRIRDYQGDRECERRKRDAEKIKVDNRRYEDARRAREKYQGKRSHRGQNLRKK